MSTRQPITSHAEAAERIGRVHEFARDLAGMVRALSADLQGGASLDLASADAAIAVAAAHADGAALHLGKALHHARTKENP
jgi:hypothetical protein